MKTATRSFYETAVERTIARIAGSLDDALDLGGLAREAALSPFHFHRVFRGMVGETPLELHRRLRLERAGWRLRARDAAITAIAFDAGYETHEAFTRAFRHAYGASPSAFRLAAAGPHPPPFELAARRGVHFDPDTRGAVARFVAAEGETAMDVTYEYMPALRVAAVHHVGPYNRIGEAFARLGAIAGRAGLLRDGSMMLAIYYDDPEATAPEQLQSDAGITVPDDARLPDDVTEKRLPAGRYARTTHVGPYGSLGDTWSRFMGEWLPGSGQRVGEGTAFEVYRNNPGNAPPDQLRTDLYLPIAPDRPGAPA